MGEPKSLAQRLASHTYDRDDVLSAMRGEKLPEHLGYPLMKCAVICGIIRSSSFAEGEAAVLHGLPEHPEFTRALNSRAIMSNRVPDMEPETHPKELPYCIWYPDVASEDTYRLLAKGYPRMRYQVARACAVAGYTDLYLELEGVLPEVAVAEEARAAGSTAIFDHIMAKPARYKVFDDYYRTVNFESPPVASLNGDTCVLFVLQNLKQGFGEPTDPDDDLAMWETTGFDEMMYNITEDQSIKDYFPYSDEEPVLSSADLMLDLLTSPLPPDLPAGNKDLLLLTAAYYGNIERYTRLRRPKPLEGEVNNIIRGIYHNGLFALFWEKQANPPEGEPFHMPWWEKIQQAITARHIMNNDISRAIASRDDEKALPYTIWYPQRARPSTYRALADRVPAMREACVRAAIFTGDVALFDDLMARPGTLPSAFLEAEAKESRDPHFLSAIRSRAKELGIDMKEANGSDQYVNPWKLYSVTGPIHMGPAVTSWVMPQHPYANMVSGGFWDWDAMLNGSKADVSTLELFLMAPESWRPREPGHTELDYERWPHSW